MPPFLDCSELRAAHRHYHGGRLDVAEAECRRVLALRPDDADAIHLLGVVALRTNRLDEAVDLLRRALGVRPGFADAWCNLAVALEARGQLVKAENACRAALRVDARHGGAWNNLGNVLKKRGGSTRRPRRTGRHYACGRTTRRPAAGWAR